MNQALGQPAGHSLQHCPCPLSQVASLSPTFSEEALPFSATSLLRLPQKSVQLDFELWVHPEVCLAKTIPFYVVSPVCNTPWARTPLRMPGISGQSTIFGMFFCVCFSSRHHWCMAAVHRASLHVSNLRSPSRSLQSACFLLSKASPLRPYLQEILRKNSLF